MLTAFAAQMLAQELPRRWVDDPDLHAVPLHVHAAADPARRRVVIRRSHFDGAIEVHRALAETIVPKWLDG